METHKKSSSHTSGAIVKADPDRETMEECLTALCIFLFIFSINLHSSKQKIPLIKNLETFPYLLTTVCRLIDILPFLLQASRFSWAITKELKNQEDILGVSGAEATQHNEFCDHKE